MEETSMKKKARKVLSVMLTLAMLLGLMPGTSIVANADGEPVVTVIDEYLIPAGGTTEVDLSGKDTGYSFNIYHMVVCNCNSRHIICQ